MRSLTVLAAALIASTTFAGGPIQSSVDVMLGPKAYRNGDVIEIIDVHSTSPKLEQGDTVTVTGRVYLKSHHSASLCLYVTATEGDGIGETDPAQKVVVNKGRTEFTLKTTIRDKGVLHVTFYDVKTGKPFGGTYFGTTTQMKSIEKMDVNYYLEP